MPKGTSQKQNKKEDSGLNFEAQLWADAKPQRADAAENRDDFSVSASTKVPRSRERERMTSGQVRAVGEKQINTERAGVRCQNFGMNRRKRWPCASTTTWKLARMNLAIRGIDANLGPRNADSFRADLHPDLKADFILATATRASTKLTLAKPDRRSVGEAELHPPLNMSDWGGENLRHDVRWKFGMPPVNNANYAWIQHFIHHLSPLGVAGFVMANGSMSTQTSNEGVSFIDGEIQAYRRI
jgi:hypothetical protein